jgi:hypothetical protein
MKNEKDIQQEVEKTLAALDSVQHAQANPFFYTRLKARMQSTEATTIHTVHILHARILLSAIGIVLLIALNLFSFLSFSSRSSEVQKEQALASFAEEYHLSYSRY